MELNYLREFVTLAENCRFQETAEALFMSQSALSKHIKAIEKEFGTELLKRSTRRVELTEFGQAFLPYAIQISALQKEYTEQLLNVSDEKTFVFGISPIVTLFTLNKFLASFPKAHPEYRIEVREGSPNELQNMLHKGECDLIIVNSSLESEDTNFLSMPYTTDHLVALVSDQHPLVQKRFLTAEDLWRYPLAQKGDMNLAQLFNADTESPTYVTNRESVLLNLLTHTTSYVILTANGSKDLLSRAPQKDFVALPLKPQTDLNLVIRYAKNKRFTPVIQSLASFLAKAHEPKGEA